MQRVSQVAVQLFQSPQCTVGVTAVRTRAQVAQATSSNHQHLSNTHLEALLFQAICDGRQLLLRGRKGRAPDCAASKSHAQQQQKSGQLLLRGRKGEQHARSNSSAASSASAAAEQLAACQQHMRRHQCTCAHLSPVPKYQGRSPQTWRHLPQTSNISSLPGSGAAGWGCASGWPRSAVHAPPSTPPPARGRWRGPAPTARRRSGLQEKRTGMEMAMRVKFGSLQCGTRHRQPHVLPQKNAILQPLRSPFLHAMQPSEPLTRHRGGAWAVVHERQLSKGARSIIGSHLSAALGGSEAPALHNIKVVALLALPAAWVSMGEAPARLASAGCGARCRSLANQVQLGWARAGQQPSAQRAATESVHVNPADN